MCLHSAHNFKVNTPPQILYNQLGKYFHLIFGEKHKANTHFALRRIQVFWVVMLCWRASDSWHVEGISCLSFVCSGSLDLPSKHRKPLTQQCNITSQKTGIINYTTVTTSEVTCFAMSPAMQCKAMQCTTPWPVTLAIPISSRPG